MIPALDLFSGIGGWTTGATRTHSVRVRVALNHDADAIEWHSAAHPEVRHLEQDAADADFGALVHEVGNGILIASPTCQQDSQCAQPARAGTGGNGVVNVQALMARNRARRSTAHAVLVAAELLDPRVLLVENVVQFERWDMFPRWCGWLEGLGYQVRVHRLNAADYGAATDRERLIVTASKGKALCLAPTYGTERRCLADCIDDDEAPENRWHPISSKPARMRELISSKLSQGLRRGVLNNVSDGVRLRPLHDLAPTLTTKSGSQLMLVDNHRVRILNPRELARMMGFPESAPLPESREVASRLIGNAVPVELAAGIIEQAEASL